MPICIAAHRHADWERQSLADFGDFSDRVTYCNQGEDAFSGYGEWYYIPDEVLPPMKDVDYGDTKPNERAIYFGTYGNDNSPGASYYTHAEIFDMDDPDDAAEFEARKAEWESKEEYLPVEDTEEDCDENTVTCSKCGNDVPDDESRAAPGNDGGSLCDECAADLIECPECGYEGFADSFDTNPGGHACPSCGYQGKGGDQSELDWEQQFTKDTE